ncbi:MAG: hypothetical protein C6W59_04165 [Paenibacillaceae bacterium]|nr:MAG: hypothetical protein C6W59_04165 [Paenibacillaceae bacterium]
MLLIFSVAVVTVSLTLQQMKALNKYRGIINRWTAYTFVTLITGTIVYEIITDGVRPFLDQFKEDYPFNVIVPIGCVIIHSLLKRIIDNNE